MRKLAMRYGLAALTVACLAVTQAQAALILVTNRAALGATATVDWGQLGPAFTPVPTGPFAVGSTAGDLVIVQQATGPAILRLDQNPNPTPPFTGTPWYGNFAPNDHLLWTVGTNGPVEFLFGGPDPVYAAGLQLQQADPGPFAAVVAVFDTSLNLLGVEAIPGISNGNADNSAPFLGVRSNVPIGLMVYGTFDPIGSSTNNFAFNTLSLSITAVPEPSSLVSSGLAVACGLGLSLRRKSRPA